MLVKELIASLQEILYEYGNIRVILQGDEEGMMNTGIIQQDITALIVFVQRNQGTRIGVN